MNTNEPIPFHKTISREEKVFENLFLKSTDGVLLLQNGQVTDANEAMCQLLDCSRADLLGKYIEEFSPYNQPDGSDSATKIQEMQSLCFDKGIHHFEWVYLRADGSASWAEIAFTPLNLEAGEVIHALWRDISEQKELEDNLFQKNQLYKKLSQELDTTIKEQSAYLIQQSKHAQTGELISMIAHQWRQPLSTIMAQIASMKLNIEVGTYNNLEMPMVKLFSDLDLLFHNIEKSAKYLSDTINNFRNFYRPDHTIRKFDLDDAIDTVLEMLLLERNGVTCQRNSLNKGNNHISTFENELQQVLMSIINNAYDAMKENSISEPKLILEIIKDDTSYTINIIDNAGGIPNDIINEIFMPYFSTKSNKNGTGLGLSMAKTIIEQHMKGRLIASNNPEYGGACFSINIPDTL